MNGRRSLPIAFPVVLIALTLAGCATDGQTGYESFLQRRGAEIIDDRTFTVCHGYGCARKTVVHLAESEWRRVRMAFPGPAASAAEERARLANAVAVLERMAGERAGTSGDVGGTFEGQWKSGQLDCVDEATNTTIYVSLMMRDGLLRWHRLRPPAYRGISTGACCWPHQSAVVTENGTGKAFALDSWFHGNGVPAEVVPLSDWLAGWTPPEVAGPAG